MKLSHTSCWLLASSTINSLNSNISAVSAAERGLRVLNTVTDNVATSGVLEDDMEGTLLIKHVQYDQEDDGGRSRVRGLKKGHAPDEFISIQLDDGRIFDLTEVDPVWKKGKGKGLKSGVDMISIGSGTSFTDGKLNLKGTAPKRIKRKPGEGKGGKGGKGKGDKDGNDGKGKKVKGKGKGKEFTQAANPFGRKLQAVNDNTNRDKTVLAVRVVTNDAAYGWTANELEDFVFDDNFSLRSQYKACS